VFFNKNNRHRDALLHNGVPGAGIIEVVIHKPDGIIAFTELPAVTGMVFSDLHRC
jgi:hypothetical protein